MIPTEEIIKEIQYITSRSSGSGGQNVNKVETRVQAIFNVYTSLVLTEYQKQMLRAKLGKKLNGQGELIVSSSESRSQFRNKETATKKLLDLLEAGLKKPIQRKPTSVPNTIREKRLQSKRIQSEKKERRRFKP